MIPQRIQLSRRKGWRMPANTVKVDRATRWGNPFVVGVHGTQAECVDLYRLLLAGLVAIGERNVSDQLAALEHARAHIADLRGKQLACWCRSGTPCHADVLLEAANR